MLHELFTRLSLQQQPDRRVTYVLSSCTAEREQICASIKCLLNVSLCSSSLNVAPCELGLCTVWTQSLKERHGAIFCHCKPKLNQPLKSFEVIKPEPEIVILWNRPGSCLSCYKPIQTFLLRYLIQHFAKLLLCLLSATLGRCLEFPHSAVCLGCLQLYHKKAEDEQKPKG